MDAGKSHAGSNGDRATPRVEEDPFSAFFESGAAHSSAIRRSSSEDRIASMLALVEEIENKENEDFQDDDQIDEMLRRMANNKITVTSSINESQQTPSKSDDPTAKQQVKQKKEDNPGVALQPVQPQSSSKTQPRDDVKHEKKDGGQHRANPAHADHQQGQNSNYVHAKNMDDKEKVEKIFSKDVPLEPSETWDFSLQALLPEFKNKCLWLEGPFYQKFVGKCLHEMHFQQCPCDERQKFPVCRLCNIVFCSPGCFKKVSQAQIGGKKNKQKESEPEEMEPSPSKPEMDPELPTKEKNFKAENNVKRSLDKANEGYGNSANNKFPHKDTRNDMRTKGSRKSHHNNQTQRHNQPRDDGRDNAHHMQEQVYPNQGPTSPNKLNGSASMPFSSRQFIPRPVYMQGNNGLLPTPTDLVPNPPLRTGTINQNQHYMSDQSPHNHHQSPMNARLRVPQMNIPNQNQYTMQQMQLQNLEPHNFAGFRDNSRLTNVPRNDANTVHPTSQKQPNHRRTPTDQPNTPDGTGPVKVFRNPKPGYALENTFPGAKTNTTNDSHSQHSPSALNREEDSQQFNNNLNNIHQSGGDRYGRTGFPQQHHQASNNPSSSSLHSRNKKPMGASRNQNNDIGSSENFTGDGRRRNDNRYNKLNQGSVRNDQTNVTNNISEDKPSVSPHNTNKQQDGADKQALHRDRRNVKFEDSAICNISSMSSKGTGFGNSTRAAIGNEQGPILTPPRTYNKYGIDSASCSSSGSGSVSSYKTAKSSFSSSSSGSFQTPHGSSTGAEDDRQEKVHPIKAEPDIPYGIPIQVKHISGTSFNDFAGVTLNSEAVIKKIKSILQNCGKDKMDIYEYGEYCMVNASSDAEEEWHRAVITKVVGKVGVYLLDIGVNRLVESKAIYKLPTELLGYRPLAIRMKCLNLKADMDDEDVCEYFSNLVESRLVKVKITHKVPWDSYLYAGSLDVFHMSKWFDAGILLQKYQVAESVSESEIEDAELEKLIISTTGLDSILTCSSGSTIQAAVSDATSLNEFYVTTKDTSKRRFKIEQKLDNPNVCSNFKQIKTLKDLSYPLFVLNDETGPRVRVKVLEVEGSASAVVQKVDYGEILTVPTKQLRKLPKDFFEPYCVFKCSLPVKPPPNKRNKSVESKPYEELTQYLTNIQSVPVTLIVYEIENSNTHIVEIVLEGSTGCAYSFVNQGWVALSHQVDLECLKQRDSAGEL